MDISNWEQFNSKIKAGHTTKKYFNKYLYKLVVFAPAGHLVDSKGSMEDALVDLKHQVRQSPWLARYHRNLDKADVKFLEVLRTLRQDKTLGIKLRIDSPHLQFYAATEQELLDLVSNNFAKDQHQYLSTIYGPENNDAKTALNDGAILRKLNSGYTHKVILRDGKYDPEVKTNLLNYLNSLGSDLIKTPGNLNRHLGKTTGYMWGVYFYTNDPSVTTFINIIHPTLVLNCHEVVVLDAK